MKKAQQSRNSAITVLVAETSRLNCQLVESAFRPRRHRVAVVASAVASQHALTLVTERKPDVAVVSVRLQEGPLEGYRFLRELRSMRIKTRAILLLESRERDLVIDAFRCGAHGVVFRDERLETLGKCIQAVHAGQVWASSEHLGYLLEELSHAMPLRLQNSQGVDLLSKRQEEVVQLVSEGLTNREIAAQLGLSEHTVRNYLFKVFDKLGVSSRVELVLYFLQRKRNGSFGNAS
jgi:DNA-binding NarL/FixJ family response regulator